MVDNDRASILVSRDQELGDAYLQEFQAGGAPPVRVVKLDLGTATLPTKPLVYSAPFTSFVVVDASDQQAKINMRLGTDESFNDSFPVQLPGGLGSKLPFRKAYLDWTAQTGKTMTIAFFYNANFATNQTNLTLSGGINIRDGGSITLTQVTLVAASATLILAADTTRKKLEFRNETGADMWLGPDNTVTNGSTTKGRIVSAGDDYSFTNQAALYAYSVPGGTLTVLSHSG